MQLAAFPMHYKACDRIVFAAVIVLFNLLLQNRALLKKQVKADVQTADQFRVFTALWRLCCKHDSQWQWMEQSLAGIEQPLTFKHFIFKLEASNSPTKISHLQSLSSSSMCRRCANWSPATSSILQPEEYAETSSSWVWLNSKRTSDIIVKFSNRSGD